MKFIRILKFEEYNPRKDRKKHSWFRVENNIFISKKLDALDEGQRWAWICLIAMCSSEQRDWTEYDIPYFQKHFGKELVPVERIEQAIAHWVSKDMIEILDTKPLSNHAVTDQTPTGNQSESGGVPTDGRTDVTDDTNVTDGQTDGSTPSVSPAVEGGSIPELQDPSLEEYLANVSQDLQRDWMAEFPDKKWVKDALKKCVVKRKAKKLPLPKDKISSIFTAWLYDEDNPPAKKPIQPKEEPEAAGPIVRRNLEEILSKHDLGVLQKIGGFHAT